MLTGAHYSILFRIERPRWLSPDYWTEYFRYVFGIMLRRRPILTWVRLDLTVSFGVLECHVIAFVNQGLHHLTRTPVKLVLSKIYVICARYVPPQVF